MKFLLQRFGGFILGVLSGLDRLVLRGKLCPLYSPDGMNIYLAANNVMRKDFEKHAHEVTQQVLASSWVARAKAMDRFRYLNSTNINKDEVARGLAAQHGVTEGLVGVLQCVEPCWSYALTSQDGQCTVRGQPRRCSHLYHYFIDPEWGWMFVRLQTWFPFELEVYVNGREWLARRLDKEGMKYERSENKILWVEDWQRAQQLYDQQLRTSWTTALDALQRQVHPLHPVHLGKMPLKYNWTVHQSEWATDLVFRSRAELERWLPAWRHQALDYDSAQVLRFFARTGRLREGQRVETEWKTTYQGSRVKYWVGTNSLKWYDYGHLLRVETTINDPSFFRVYRTAQDNPDGPLAWREMRRGVADLHRRTEISQKVNDRCLQGMATVREARNVRELAEPLCVRVSEPGAPAARKVRALNPWSKADGALLLAISNPKWMIVGLRNRDLVAELYPQTTNNAQEKRRRSSRVTRLFRLLRGHGLLQKVPHTHRYQISAEARTTILALLAAGNANPQDLTSQAA